mmetsp:Transcript_3386/g.10350  ORF Transcript_3386/g.10350 Transcript_3386/m.10350 type:complete len:82 (-) Transcript_3386:157-402(-)
MLLCERSLKIREIALGPDHVDVAASLDGIAWLLKAQGKYGQMIPICKRSLQIYETTLGPDHPKVTMSLKNLIGLLTAQVGY